MLGRLRPVPPATLLKPAPRAVPRASSRIFAQPPFPSSFNWALQSSWNVGSRNLLGRERRSPFSSPAFSSSSSEMAAKGAPPPGSALRFLAASKGAREGVLVTCHVKPNAQDSAVQLPAGEPDVRLLEALPVRLAAAPRDGEANKELEQVISKVLGVRKSQCSLLKGGKSKDKVIECEGIGLKDASERILQAFPPPPDPTGASAPPNQQKGNKGRR